VRRNSCGLITRRESGGPQVSGGLPKCIKVGRVNQRMSVVRTSAAANQRSSHDAQLLKASARLGVVRQRRAGRGAGTPAEFPPPNTPTNLPDNHPMNDASRNGRPIKTRTTGRVACKIFPTPLVFRTDS